MAKFLERDFAITKEHNELIEKQNFFEEGSNSDFIFKF
jgi:hypothetical protein